jgi:hypothetical protein
VSGLLGIAPALAPRLRRLAVESWIDRARFERRLSLAIDRAVVACEELSA